MRLALMGLLTVALVACTAATPSGPWSGPPDAAAAAEQARTFVTFATPDTWGNYGEQFTRFCEVKFGFDCNREDRDRSEDVTMGQQLSVWEAEKNNPVSVLSDNGIMFVNQAETLGVLPDYRPPNADLLPPHLSGDGWVATFLTAPILLLNLDFLEANNLPQPESWADLTNPAYAGLVGMQRVGISGSGTATFVAMNLAAGGTLEDFGPGIEYARRLVPNLTSSANYERFARGETPIAVRWDFQPGLWAEDLHAEGIRYRVVMPTEGTVAHAQVLLLNRYETSHTDFAKMFMEWLLTDEAQFIFAKSGSRPVRAVVGENPLVVPDEYRVNWLPDEDYARVQLIDWRQVNPEELQQMWENQVVGGG
jgi:putative spermidine/putrescine transport system substrate-binding protein